MSIYDGKHLDFFEDSISMLLVNSEYSEIEDIDCISLRNASFVNNGDIKYWFKSGVDIYETIKNIEEALGTNDLFNINKITKDDVEQLFTNDSKYVLGPIEKKSLLQKIDANYYDAERNYIYCFVQNGKLFVHEPDGVPYLIVNKRDLLKMFGKKEYLFQISVKPNVSISVPKRNMVLKKWMERKLESKLQKNDVSNYDYSAMNSLNVSNEIAFGFGIKNYLIQTSKMFEFLAKNNNGDNDLFTCYSEELIDILKEKQYKKINQIINKLDIFLIKRIWEELR